MKQEDQRQIEASELWCWRKMLRVSWTAKMLNQEVLVKINSHHSMVMPFEAIALKHKWACKWARKETANHHGEGKKKKRITKDKVDGW